MEIFREVWKILQSCPDIIRSLLPWDVGQSEWLLWGSVALFVVAGLTASQLFGWLCGWIVSRLVNPTRR